MRDYNINDLIKILKCHNPNEIYLSPHVLENCFERDYSLNYVHSCLLEKIPLSIRKTSENRFLLIYPHETIKFQDLYIVIEINDDEKITVVTVYCFDKRRREREVKR